MPAGVELAEDNVPGFGRLRSASRAAPFIALILAGFLVIPLPPSGDRPGPLIAAAVLLATVVVGAAMAPWQQLPGSVQLLPILGFLGVVALLRDAEGGAASAETPLALVPVFWCALYGTRSQLAAVIAGVAAMFVVPRLVIGPPDYPVTEWERAIIWPVTGLVVGLTVQGLVARIKLQAEQLKKLAATDALTGLANRRSWDDSLGVEVDRARRTDQPLALVLLDLNGFKSFNDAHGHPAADHLLKEMASSWTSALRTTDTLARLGGDEFGLILPGLTVGEARAVVTRLEELIPAKQTVAAGIIESDGTERPEEMLARADRALYRSKAAHPTVATELTRRPAAP